MNLKKIIKLFCSGNVCVTGLRGTGKDLLFGNVITRLKKPYISNLNYSDDDLYQELDLQRLDAGKNTFKNFINHNIKYYDFDYIKGSDIYISDAGIYFPSQHCGELNKMYPYFATYQALSRQISHNNVHVNVQNLNRLWDKIREQSDIYIRCIKTIYLFGWVIQSVVVYDKYDACVNRVKPLKMKVPLFADKNTKQHVKMYIDNFQVQNGSIKQYTLIYKNKSKHDTYYFEKMMKEGEKND